MSGTNAIHGIILVGAMLVAGSADSTLEQVLAFVAIVFGTVNVVGGFLVTDRMLDMFKRRPERDDVSQNWVNLIYAGAAILLCLGIKRLSSPATARSGNLVAAVGMTIAVVVTLFSPEIDSYGLIFAGIAVGTVIGVASARMVRMTAMPQMVALFNGVGGGAAALIAAAEFHRLAPLPRDLAGDVVVGIMFSALIGSISLLGEHGRVREAPGAPARAAARLPGPEHRERAALRRHRSAAAVRRGDRPRTQIWLVAAPGRRAHLRRHARPADRRRGHAGRHLVPERVHRARGRRDRLRALEQRA